jgi:hypothetical protein
MAVLVDSIAWAEHHFAGVQLGHKRRTRRLVRSAAQIARHPEKSFPQIFNWNDLRGFYRLCNQKQATLPTMQLPHWQHTRHAMRQHPLVLIVHDTTELDFASHKALRGAGPLGEGHGRGFLQHNSLAVLPQPRQLLGLAYQQWHVRQPAPRGERPAQRKQRQRESQLWLEGIGASGPAPEGCCWVDVGDRGSDLYEAMRAARAVGHHFLFRLTQNRTVFPTPAQEKPVYLLTYARSLPSQGSDIVTIPSRGGRCTRTATVQLAAAPVWVPAPWGTPKRWSQPMVAAWVIRIWEANPPADVQAPLEWLLLGSLPTTTEEELKERRDWYSCRWMAEVFHDIEKNGCSEEDRRFEEAGSMEACLALLSVVAVRVYQLRCALEVQPAAPAEQVATAAEIAVVRGSVGHQGKGFTVREFVRGVARLGGFLGRKRDGTPGVRALWRGYQRLHDMVQGYQLHGGSSLDST